mmetsp:Transcript_67766/g.181381  ORF Transcript_67766/g.181381 Transcript_67766/m.181381 type:complete len:221 (-) Transcript_67766:292-954(-)
MNFFRAAASPSPPHGAMEPIAVQQGGCNNAALPAPVSAALPLLPELFEQLLPPLRRLDVHLRRGAGGSTAARSAAQLVGERGALSDPGAPVERQQRLPVPGLHLVHALHLLLLHGEVHLRLGVHLSPPDLFHQVVLRGPGELTPEGLVPHAEAAVPINRANAKYNLALLRVEEEAVAILHDTVVRVEHVVVKRKHHALREEGRGLVVGRGPRGPLRPAEK